MHVRRARAAALAAKRRIPSRIAVASAAALLAVLAAAPGASADPSVGDKRAQARAVIAEIQKIDEEVEAAAERWNAASLELESLTVELDHTRRDLARARRLLAVSRHHVGRRLRQLYVEGSPDSTVEVLLGARSLEEVITGLEATQRIAAQDAGIARDAKALRARVAEREEQLTGARARQAETVEQLAAERQAIEGRLADRQRLLVSVEEEIARLEEAEERRQAELERQARLELERQQRSAGAEAAGEPAETAGEPTSAPASGPGYAPPPADASRSAQVVAIAMRYLGVPYVWGGASPSQGFDCSGLTMYVYAQIGIRLPHYAAAQYELGVAVPKSRLAPGDLVFFRNLEHVGMYVGGGNFIHAPRTGDVVKISPLSDPYYVEHWVGARRLL